MVGVVYTQCTYLIQDNMISSLIIEINLVYCEEMHESDWFIVSHQGRL